MMVTSEYFTISLCFCHLITQSFSKKSLHEMGEFTLDSTLYEPFLLSFSFLPETFEPLASSYKNTGSDIISGRTILISCSQNLT